MPPVRPLHALLLGAVAALAVAPGAHAAPACAGADAQPTGANVAAIRHATLCLLNQERHRRGLGALRTNTTLEQVAQSYSRQMVAKQFFDHTSPGGSTVVDRLKGYVARATTYTLGENLAWGDGALATPRQAVRMWMRSPGHRRNILNGAFREIGIGIAVGTPGDRAAGATYTTEFGHRTR